jgi:diguanylate cyclase (GGDEF)-like protein/PAS domain S-box-containing protein
MNLFSNALQAILDQINDGVYFVDSRRRILFWNHAAERISGYSSEQVVGQFCMANILMHVNHNGEQLCHGLCPLVQSLKDGQIHEGEVYLHHADGHRVPVVVRIMPVRDEENVIRGAVETFNENISLYSALLRIEELQRVALRDELTGIGNRRMIQAALQKAYQDWEQHGLSFGLLMIDIDHFKTINDRYGHDLGDKALKMVTNSLTRGLRSYDHIGRWGGEEFLAVVANVDLPGLRFISERLRMLVETSLIFLDEVERSYDRAVRVTISVGGALVMPGQSVEQALELADRNLYASKDAGRNRVTI